MNIQDWLGKDNEIGLNIWNNKYRFNEESFDEWLDRVSLGDAELRDLIASKKFLFGGRVLSNVGTGGKESFFNCYSRGYVEDTLEDILQAVKDIGLTFKAQGGQGLSLSKIRPKGTNIGERYNADGIVPFMKLFNTATESISQGGHRRGALMMSLDCWHKEIEDFIDIKTKDSSIEKANLSVEVDDEFMIQVAHDLKNGTETLVDITTHFNGHKVEYTICPVKVFKKICANAHDWAEPGVLFVEKLRYYNLMQCVDGYDIETTNPCGEQPLPKHFSCNLGSLNLSEFVKDAFKSNASFDFSELFRVMPIAIRGLDTLIDLNKDNHALAEQKENSLNYRNIGLGVFGYADMLMKLGLTYGSEKAIQFTGMLFSFLFYGALWSSSLLAVEKGTFPKYSEKMMDSEIFVNFIEDEHLDQTLTQDLKKHIQEHGLRNCSLLSVAPTGSIATMLGMSGGCEPHFALSYTRTTKSLTGDEDRHYEMNIPTLSEYYEKIDSAEFLPEWAISSEDISYHNRIKTQAIMQQYVDTAISSTINLSNETTVEEVEQLYLEAWRAGLKGITIFRSGGARTAILNKTTDEPKETQEVGIAENYTLPALNLKRGQVIQVNDDIVGKKRKLVTGCGTLHCTAFFNNTTGELVETYFSKGSTGGCNNFMIGLSRVISLAARGGISIYDIFDQLMSCGTCSSYAVRSATKKDTSKGACCPMAIGYALKDMYQEMAYELELEHELLKDKGAQTKLINKPTQIIGTVTSIMEDVPVCEGPDADLSGCAGCENIQYCQPNHPSINQIENPCPICGAELVFEGGCDSCKSCGYSKCD